MKRLHATISATMLALGALLTGCNPEGPGATGEISLGIGVETKGMKTLEIRAIPDPELTFNPAKPPFPTVGNEDLWSASADLGSVTFPYTYKVGELVGTTDHEVYRLFAWLSESGSGDAPASGERYGTVSFSLLKCGAAVDEYSPIDDFCGVTYEVNATIELTAP